MALLAAFAIAVTATPAGISGAVLLLPFQVSVLGTPSPAVTPTNLLYNVVATPGALYRYRRQHQTGGRLALLLTGGTLPGVIAGSVIRVELIPGPKIFDLVVSAVLLPLGAWLTATRPVRRADPARPPRNIPIPVRIGLAGCVGGIYGIGGGSILSPVLIGAGRPAADVAPAALDSTFVTSITGRRPSLSCLSTTPAQSPPTGRPVSPSASAAWPAATPEPASRPVCPTPSSGGSSASSSSPSAPGTYGPAELRPAAVKRASPEKVPALSG